MGGRTLSIADVIRERRTIRQFAEMPLTKETIVELLDVAVWAPNHGLREPWRFICAAELEAKERLADATVAALCELKRYKLMPGKIKEMYKRKMAQYPAILFVVAKGEKSRLKRDDERIAGILYIGYFNRTPKPKPRTPAQKKMTWL